MACCGLEASHNASAWVADTQINSHQRSNHEFWRDPHTRRVRAANPPRASFLLILEEE